MKSKLDQFSPEAQQVFCEVIGNKLKSNELAESNSYLERVLHDIYVSNAESSYDHSAEETGFLAVEGYLQRLKKCIDKEIPPQKIINAFLPSEQKIMLGALNKDEKMPTQKVEQYIDVKNALNRRKFFAAGLVGSIAGSAALMMHSDTSQAKEEGKELQEKLNSAKDMEQDAIERLVQNSNTPDPQAVQDLEKSRRHIKNIQATLKQRVGQSEQTNNYKVLVEVLGGSLIGAFLAGIFVDSAFNVGLNRSGLEDYEKPNDFLGIAPSLNEQLIDQALKIETNKFQTSIDDFLMTIINAKKAHDSGQGLSL